MKRLLIVEDEKLIRQGLRAIIQRSAVKIDEILECRNGKEALEILRQAPVDVVFTDVRMPHMDGITLIKKIQEELAGPHPEIVVVSGHDDFNYAVEAMRYGSREYILKPVERQRVFDVLEKLEELLSQKRESRINREEIEQITRQQLKYVLLNPDITADEVSVIKNAFHDLLVFNSYVVLCLNRKVELAVEETAFQLDNVGWNCHVMVLQDNRYKEFAERNLKDYYVGASTAHKELDNFKQAFEEAVEARKYAFFTGKRLANAGQIAYLEETVQQQLTPRQLSRQVGTREYPNLVHFFNGMFVQAARGRLYPHLFEEFVLDFIDAICDTFSRLMEDNKEDGEALRAVYSFDTVDTYRLAFLEWLDVLHAKAFSQVESFKNRERMKDAVAFIEENYGKNLNMAVVSNHISMNYSVFSQLFKEYSGQNFVDYLRDYRINKARELLTYTDMKVSEISASIGYENDKYFMKSFKSIVGVSPTQFRKTEQMKIHGKLL